MKPIAKIITQSSINLVYLVDGVSKSFIYNSEHKRFQKLVDAIKANDWAAVKDIVDAAEGIKSWSQGKVKLESGKLYVDDRELHEALAKRVTAMLDDGFTVDPLIAFIDNLMQNPSKRAVDELFGFLEKNDLPLTDDGHFLAYKKVRDDYKDIYTGTMDNSVGQIVQVTRNMVDEDKNRTCSQGLHFASLSYMPHYGVGEGNRIVLVKINPADVVAIPTDYNDQKGRCCRYEVVGEHDSSILEKFNKSVYNSKEFTSHEDEDGYGYGDDETALYEALEEALDNVGLPRPVTDSWVNGFTDGVRHATLNLNTFKPTDPTYEAGYDDAIEYVNNNPSEVKQLTKLMAYSTDIKVYEDDGVFVMANKDDTMKVLNVSTDALRKRVARGTVARNGDRYTFDFYKIDWSF